MSEKRPFLRMNRQEGVITFSLRSSIVGFHSAIVLILDRQHADFCFLNISVTVSSPRESAHN